MERSAKPKRIVVVRSSLAQRQLIAAKAAHSLELAAGAAPSTEAATPAERDATPTAAPTTTTPITFE